MDDLFNSPTLTIEQPGKLLATQARYEIFDGEPALLAVAEETDGRSRGRVLLAALPIAPPPGAQVLVVRDPQDQHLLTLLKPADNRRSEVRDPAGDLVGAISALRTTRHYALTDGTGTALGQVTGDLALRRFAVTDPAGIDVGVVTKKWAGLAKELLTTADKYSVQLSDTVSPALRTLVVMTAIVLDLALHENLGGR